MIQEYCFGYSVHIFVRTVKFYSSEKKGKTNDRLICVSCSRYRGVSMILILGTFRKLFFPSRNKFQNRNAEARQGRHGRCRYPLEEEWENCFPGSQSFTDSIITLMQLGMAYSHNLLSICP